MGDGHIWWIDILHMGWDGIISFTAGGKHALIKHGLGIDWMDEWMKNETKRNETRMK